MSDGTTSIIVIVSIYFFLMAMFCCYKGLRNGDRNGGIVNRSLIGGIISRRENRGLDPAVIETFPIFVYSIVKGLKLGKGALECAVCLNEFQDDDVIRLLHKCDHVFHPDCIDAWLSNRTTCPVCRANLVPESAEDATGVPIHELDGESEGEIRGSETEDAENQGVSVHVISEEEPLREVAVAVAVAPELINPVQSDTPNRSSRVTKPRFAGRFPRSHTTGHSLVQPGEDIERFTLRLPDDVRKQIMNDRLKRTSSMMELPTEGSSRRGYRRTGEGSSRGGRERWVFSMMPSFFTKRAFSGRSPKMTTRWNATVTPPLTPRA